MADDVNLGDLVSAFRLELRDGLAKLDSLGQTLSQFEGRAKASLGNVGDAGKREGDRMAAGLASGLSQAGRSLAGFLAGIVGVGGFLEGVRRLGEAFVRENAEADTFVSRLASVTGSMASARGEYQRLEEFARTWGVKIGELVDGYIQLSQRGITPTDAALKGLGNAAAATGMQMGEIARAIASATMDGGRFLRTFGIEMKIVGDKVAFDWADAQGRMKKVTVENVDSIIEKTLTGIFSDRYSGQMERAVSGWRGMVTVLGTLWDEWLKKIGDEGAWKEVKAQMAGLVESMKKGLAGPEATEAARTWSNIFVAVAQVVGAIVRGITQIPLGLKAASLLLGMLLADIAVGFEKSVVFMMQAAERLAGAMSFIPGMTSFQTKLNSAIAIGRDTIAGTTKQAEDFYKKGMAMGTVMDDMTRSALAASEKVRDLGTETEKAARPMSALSIELANANKELAAQVEALLLAKGVYTAASLDKAIGDIVEQMLRLHAAGVPSVEILEAYAPALAKLADRAKDFQPGELKMADTLEQWGTAATWGKEAFDSLFQSFDRDWASIIKTKLAPGVISVRDSTGEMAAALTGGFGKAFDNAFADGERKFKTLVGKLGNERITIAVDISDMDLAAKLSRLGYTPKGMPDTSGHVPK